MDQQCWIMKLMGFDYDILYRPGHENKVVDALSRMYSDLNAIFCPQHSWLEELHCEARNHPELVALKKTIACETTTTTKFTEKGGLPISYGFSVILVLVDHLTMYGHFITMKHPYTARTVATTFVKEISRLHCMLCSIVSDRDKVFTSQFWTEYFRLQDSELQMSSTY